ncbi:MAG: hypothetical protein NTU85_00120 [Candidatus Kaiserbacteria bacterium]|nr:hypothetical protein [Candidatus Kaiserbacteria bacterium]
MTDIRRYIENKTYEELLETQKNSVVGGDVHEAVTLEIQRIQQDTNNIQIAKLIGEIKKLKEITDKNAKISTESAQSSNKLSKVAIWIAIAMLITQIMFSTHQKSDCVWITSTGNSSVHYSGCYRQFDFGLLGTYTFSLPDR